MLQLVELIFFFCLAFSPSCLGAICSRQGFLSSFAFKAGQQGPLSLSGFLFLTCKHQLDAFVEPLLFPLGLARLELVVSRLLQEKLQRKILQASYLPQALGTLP